MMYNIQKNIDFSQRTFVKHTKKHIGFKVNKLEKYLKHRGMSQKRFCEKIGLTANNLCLLLKGKTTPTLQTAYKIEMMTGGLVTVYDWIPEDVKKMQKEIEEN